MISYLIVTIIIIIIIIVCTEYYFRYYKIETIDNIELNNNTTTSIVNYPWDKIVKKTKYTHYYIKITNMNNRILSEWQEIINNIRYDNKYIIIKTTTEEEALSILNLFISNINNEISIQDIIDNDMINLSKKKAISYKLVKKKLIDLIRDGLTKINTEKFDSTNYINKYFDTNTITDFRSSDNRNSDNRDTILSINRENLMNVHEHVIDYNKNDTMNNVESKPRETMFNNMEAKPRETMFNNMEAKPVDTNKQCTKSDPDIVIDEELFTDIDIKHVPMIKPYGGSEYATILFK